MNRSLATRHSPLATRPGFTLVEMLTVVVIIGILASLLTAAVIAARKKVRVAVIHAEVMQLDLAVRAVQADYGDPPPDFSDWTGSDSIAVDRWLLKAFPRYILTGTNTASAQMVSDIQTNYGVNVANPASALVVFLGGVPGVAGTYNAFNIQTPTGGIPWRSDGFSADATHPFSPGQPRIKAKFEFPANRVNTSTGAPCFCPPGVSATAPTTIPAPYVYFRAGLDQNTGAWCYNYYNGAATLTQTFYPPGNSTDLAVPYQKVVPSGNNAVINPPWRNNDSFQIISSGLDGLYGFNRAASAPYVAGRVASLPSMLSIYPSGGGDFDNITNFITNGSTLENELTP
jgi:prepilin-type N-terminal cleavage/methylation domain-containing protein